MSGIATGTALLLGGGLGLAGSLGGAAIEGSAANNAASKQEDAALQAAQLQYQASQNALGFQEGQYANSQQELAPWLQSGAEGLSQLDYELGLQQPGSLGGQNGAQGYLGGGTSLPNGGGTAQYPGLGQPNGGPAQGINAHPMTSGAFPGGTGAGTPGVPVPINTSASPNPSTGGFGSLMQAYPGGPFQAPTLQQAEQMPGYQFQLQQGNQLLQQSAAAKGNLLTGGTAEALNQFGQGLAQTDYNNLYNQALTGYDTNFNAFQQNQANQYNRLASLAGVGQQTAGQLGTLGQNASNGITSNLLGTASAIGQQYNNAAAANASGIVGSANAWGGALGNSAGNLSQLALLQQIYGGNGTDSYSNWSI